MWLILFSINIPPFVVFPSAITLGNKPANLDFLNDTIHELKTILENGIIINNVRITIILSTIVCDVPV